MYFITKLLLISSFLQIQNKHPRTKKTRPESFINDIQSENFQFLLEQILCINFFFKIIVSSLATYPVQYRTDPNIMLRIFFDVKYSKAGLFQQQNISLPSKHMLMLLLFFFHLHVLCCIIIIKP